MTETDRLLALEEENRKLKKDNERLLCTIQQMRVTINRLINRYIIEDSSRKMA